MSVSNKKIHKDCPFNEEEIMTFYDMLYQVNAGNHCANPSHPSWVMGSQMHEQIQRSNRHENIMDEVERLRRENAELKNQLRLNA